jgi:dCMP deaminase
MFSNDRLSREEMLMSIARVISFRGSCPKLRVGAVIAYQGRIISIGYNGSAPGLPHCLDVGCELDEKGHCIRTIHAEMNAIAWAARYGISTDECELYTTNSPCVICAKAIASAGILKVHYQAEYDQSHGLIYLEKTGIQIQKHNYEETSFIKYPLG